MHSKLSKFIFSTFKEAFEFINPFLNNYSDFSNSLSQQVKIKKGNSIQYEFDLKLDEIFKKHIKNHGISGLIYSEESGFYNWGNNDYKVVFDPFCNSTLASRGFREAASGISIFSSSYEFITAAIIDYQTGLMAFIVNDRTHFYQIQTKKQIHLTPPKEENIENAWIVFTLEKQKEMKYIKNGCEILQKANRILISSGHIYWLKLATGSIDGYLDPFGGEKLYEMFACTVAQKNGCIVSNSEGEIFEPSKYLKIFEENPDYVFYPVAASNPLLHRQILKNL